MYRINAALDELIIELKAPLIFYLLWLFGKATKIEDVAMAVYVKYFIIFRNIIINMALIKIFINITSSNNHGNS